MASVSFFRPPLEACAEPAGPSQRDLSCELDFFFEKVESFDEASSTSSNQFAVHRRHRLLARRRPIATPIDVRSLRGGFRDKVRSFLIEILGLFWDRNRDAKDDKQRQKNSRRSTFRR